MQNSENLGKPQTPRQYARIFFSGIAMGAADVVPGVSGGTMAFILGIYQTLLDGIKSFNFDVLRTVLRGQISTALEMVPFRFLVALGLGILTAIFTLASLLSWLLENEPEYLFAFFFGLVAASIIAVGAKIDRWTPQAIGAFIIAALGAFVLVGLSPSDNASHSTPTLFFSGAIAIMAMILPGISGSFILLLLGQYEYVLNAVKDFNFQVIITVGLGAVLGLMLFSRILSWLLHNYERLTLAILTGFMLGSLRKIWPWREAPAENLNVADHAEEFTRAVLPQVDTGAFWFALLLILIGFVIVTALDHMQSRQNPAVVLLLRAFAGRKVAPSPDESAV